MSLESLVIRDLVVKTNDRLILNGLNLKINRGEVHAIMGPNGSGKSTLSNIIAGKSGYDIQSGSITFLDQNILLLSPEERATLRIQVTVGLVHRRRDRGW